MGCFKKKILIDNKCTTRGEFSGYTFPFLIDERNIPEFMRELQSLQKKNCTFALEMCPVQSNVAIINYMLVQLGGNFSSMPCDHYIFESIFVSVVSSVISNPTLSKNIKAIKRLTERSLELVDSANQNYTMGCLISGRPLISELLTCVHVKFSRNEYIEENSQITIPKHGVVLQFNEYQIDDDESLMICRNRFEKVEATNIHQKPVAISILVTLNAISAFFLVITILVYSSIASMRNIPGTNIMSLSISLCCHNISLIFVLTTRAEGPLCVLIGLVAHYFLLTSICCLFVCAWHIYKIFGTGSVATSVETRSKTSLKWKYGLLSYGHALAIVLVYIIVSVIVTSGDSIGYGGVVCFITFKEGVIIALLVPLIIFSISDVVLFVVTVYHLRKRPRLKCNSSTNKKDIWIFLKLFVTTGCSWTLFLVNILIDDHIITLIISSLNSLQGLFIFVAYICNRRTYNLCKEKCKEHSCLATSDVINKSPSTSLTSLSRLKTDIQCKHSVLVQKP